MSDPVPGAGGAPYPFARPAADVIADLLALAAKATPVYATDPALAGQAGANGQAGGGLPPAGPGPAPSGLVNDGEERSILNTIMLDVLGHYPDGSVDIFSRSRRQVHRVGNVARFGYPELILYCGELARDCVHPGREVVSGRYMMDQVRNAIALFAGQVSLVDCTPVGQGVWWADGHVTLINGGRAAVYNPNGRLHPVDVPRVGRQILDFSATEEWVDFDKLQNYLNLTAVPSWGEAVMDEAIGLFQKWFWRHPVDAAVIASLVVCSWVQTLWTWRPEVAIAGPSDSGKSSLLDSVLMKLFGRMALYFDKPSEAGIRQHVRNKAAVIIVDEFESDQHRQRVLDMFRMTSRGGEVMRGSSDQRGRKYTLRHIPWMAAIESGLNQEADRNRVILLNLERPPAGKRGKLSLPTDDQMGELGVKLLALGLRHYAVAQNLFLTLKTLQFPGVHGRLVESYSTPAAMLAAVRGATPDQARAILSSFLKGKNLMGQGVADESSLMKVILESHLDVGQGRRRSVAEIVSNESVYGDCHEALARHGIMLVCEHRGPRGYPKGPYARLFFNPGAVRRFLLRFTDWAEKDLGQLLERLPDAKHTQRRVLGKRVWGWDVPAQDYIHPSDGTSEEEQVDAMLADLRAAPNGDLTPAPGETGIEGAGVEQQEPTSATEASQNEGEHSQDCPGQVIRGQYESDLDNP